MVYSAMLTSTRFMMLGCLVQLGCALPVGGVRASLAPDVVDARFRLRGGSAVALAEAVRGVLSPVCARPANGSANSNPGSTGEWLSVSSDGEWLEVSGSPERVREVADLLARIDADEGFLRGVLSEN